MMAKRKRSRESEKSLDTEKQEDETRPDLGEGAMLAAVDQHEAEVRGEANTPPGDEGESEKPAEEKPEADPNAVHLRVFAQVGGLKWDQLAGFKHHAKRNKLGPMTVQKWREAFAEFMGKPVK
jgi:hypothetical protein